MKKSLKYKCRNCGVEYSSLHYCYACKVGTVVAVVKDPVISEKELLRRKKQSEQGRTEIKVIGKRLQVYKRDGFTCLRCGKKALTFTHNQRKVGYIVPGLRLTLDHIIPRSKGGHNGISNLQTLCNKCNEWKGIKIIDYRK